MYKVIWKCQMGQEKIATLKELQTKNKTKNKKSLKGNHERIAKIGQLRKYCSLVLNDWIKY